MKISATQIDDWAKKIEARSSLPRLVRKLIHASGTPRHVSFPAGDSTNLPGWDGELNIEYENAWVPRGKSYWEFSCESQITKKANKDYYKRVKETDKVIRADSVFVIVTARRWSRKARWLKEKRELGDWADIRAYDADDIEQWLEQSPAVALQFSEELGLTGQGVESVPRHWNGWSQQSDPPITSNAFFIDREDTRQRFIVELRNRFKTEQFGLYSIRADSVGEAVAFACAAIMEQPDLSSMCLVVTETSGWRFVEQNTTLKIVIAAIPEIAEKPTLRNGLIVIIPYAAGDMARYSGSMAVRERSDDLTLDRPRIYEFKKALITIGLDEDEATRLAVSTGRSWSVFRRHRAVNPAIRRPVWLDSPQARALSVLCLLGGWSANRDADREIVARLSARAFEDVERDLRYLSLVDDSPVLRIGEIWKAKSPLELFDLFGGRITRDEFDRFFIIAGEILTAPDPQLELPNEERYAAQIHGKVRPQSSLLIKSICDSLIRLAVRGGQLPVLLETDIEGRIAAFVRNVLNDADEIRWLSLSSLLPSLAEAAPDAFLQSVEMSLTKPEAPITRVLTETTSSGLFGSRCWYAGLLWALEILAWAPEFLPRVVLVLARLAHVEIQGNWANSPLASLVDIFRTWLPQTAANLDQRVKVLDTLIDKDPDIAFTLLDRIVNIGHDFANPTARPRWRDYDVGAGHGVTVDERFKMLIAAADRLIICSAKNPHRIACLIGKIDILDLPRKKKIFALAAHYKESTASDEDREIIRIALRQKINRLLNYNKAESKASDNELHDIKELYENLTPNNLIIRHRWLFSDGWIALPVCTINDDYYKHEEILESLRIAALREIHDTLGMQGIEEIASICSDQPLVGLTLAKIGLEISDLAAWIVGSWNNRATQDRLQMTFYGLLRSLLQPHSTELINAVLQKGVQLKWTAEQMADFLVLARPERSTWEIVASCGIEVENDYWVKINPGPMRSDNRDHEFVLQHLLRAGRPRTALQVSLLDLKHMDANLLAEMLERMLQGEEPNGPLLDSWHVGEAIECLEASGTIEKGRLVRLEFGLIPALGFAGEHRAKLLYEEIMSEPRLFTELLCIRYKPEHSERADEPTDAMKAAADIAWNLLNACVRQPGTRHDGTIDPEAFLKFIDEARELCRQADRLKVCDVTIGQIFAHAPLGTDNIWPFEPVRDILENPEFEDMRNGFFSGVLNSRGVTTRACDDGGDQERKLAERYRGFARALNNSHPYVSSILEKIARCYDREGHHEDLEAALRRETY